jgi:hypothetical protein
MLCFGNFVYAYRKLSRIKSDGELYAQLGDHCRDTKDALSRFKQRGKKLLEITPIPRDDTYLVGYLSATEVEAEYKSARYLHDLLNERDNASWDDLKKAIAAQPKLVGLIDKYQKRVNRNSPEDMSQTLAQNLPHLENLRGKIKSTQAQGEKNTDVYLTWDHMDVYFATSMRQHWEYEELYDLIDELMKTDELKDLDLRYFDPTQSFSKNRIDKGLIESLMLKRSICTVYSVQDTDTLGKDSELAATLAQGKPVIAYAPAIDVEKLTNQLIKQRPAALKERLIFMRMTDGEFADEFQDDLGFIMEFIQKINNFEKRLLWQSLKYPKLREEFLQVDKESLERFCKIIASSEKRIYEKRVKTLKQSHPLAIQVNLDTGVANGVLVARDVKTCALLLRRILINEMEFDLKFDSDTNCWHLVEKLTQSIYRVVTNNTKLTNCFWNFYMKGH